MDRCYVGTPSGLLSFSPSEPRKAELLGFDQAEHGAIRSPLLRDLDRAEVRYLATLRSGVWISDDAGGSWQELNDGLIYREVWWIAQHPKTRELFAGTGPAGVFRLACGERRWREVEALRSVEGRDAWSLHLPPYFARLRGIAFGHEDVGVVLGAIEEGWVVLSRDDGQSWACLRDGLAADVHMALVTPRPSAAIVAATGLGMYQSADGGSSFERQDDFEKPYATHVLAHPGRPEVLFGAGADNLPRYWRRQEGAGTGFFRSDDAGSSWRRLTKGLPDFLPAGPHAAAFHADAPSTVLVGLSDGSIWLSDDDCDSFRTLIEGLPAVTSLALFEE